MTSYSFGPFVLDPAARVLRRDDLPVDITAKVFETLLLLVENRGRVLAKDELLTALWPNTTVEEANLTQSISTLRKVLNDNPKEHRYVATIPGRGYSFVGPVVERPDSNVAERASAAASPAYSRPSPAFSLSKLAALIRSEMVLARRPYWQQPWHSSG